MQTMSRMATAETAAAQVRRETSLLMLGIVQRNVGRMVSEGKLVAMRLLIALFFTYLVGYQGFAAGTLLQYCGVSRVEEPIELAL